MSHKHSFSTHQIEAERRELCLPTSHSRFYYSTRVCVCVSVCVRVHMCVSVRRQIDQMLAANYIAGLITG